MIYCDAQSVKLCFYSKGGANLDQNCLVMIVCLTSQNRIRARQHVSNSVRFADDFVDARLVVIFLGDHLGETSRDNYRHVGTELLDPPRDMQATQLGHPEIANHTGE